MALSQPAGASPARRCIVTGSTYDKAELIRFVVGPENVVVPDVACKLPGRGMWVSCDKDAVQQACDKRLFAGAAKQGVNLRDDLIDLVESLLYERALASLALARKAGAAVHGFEKVASMLQSKQAIALLHASDAASDGVAKLRPYDTLCVSSRFTREDLSRVMGTDNAVHVGIANQDAGRDFLEQLRRFCRFVNETPL